MRKREYWTKPNEDGVAYFDMNSWSDFVDFLNSEMTHYKFYIWRGQRDSKWPLESSLDRLLKQYRREDREDLREKHLSNFKLAIRGRRGTSPKTLSNDEYWALGQHYGLATPLLDWTVSPYVAAFFALHNIPFMSPSKAEVSTESYAIYALNRYSVIEQAAKMKLDISSTVSVIEPFTDENPRLVNQGGLFTKLPSNTDMESYIKRLFEGEKYKFALIKFIIPFSNKKREKVNEILLSLNRMNINASTLFPDLQGSSLTCNMQLAIPTY